MHFIFLTLPVEQIKWIFKLLFMEIVSWEFFLKHAVYWKEYFDSWALYQFIEKKSIFTSFVIL